MGGDIEGVLVESLQIIETPSGDVLQAMKCTDDSFLGFGEAYFSKVKEGVIKGWKRHRQMTLNLVVPMGVIKFVMYDDRVSSATKGVYQEVILSNNNYCRLTIPPLIWMGFQGIGDGLSLLMNIANILHNESDLDRNGLSEIEYDWRIK